MALHGTPASGLTWVGQVVGTNLERVRPTDDALTVALTLLSTQTPGAPVLDAQAHGVGFVSESDVLLALSAGKDLRALTAQDIMACKPVTVTGATTIVDAARILLDTGFTTLPVERHGVVAYSLTRHDLLRAWIGLGLGGGG